MHKPRIPFGHVKELFGEHLEKYGKAKNETNNHSLSKQEIEVVKSQIRKRLRQEEVRENSLKIILLVGVVLIIILAFIALNEVFVY